MTRTTYNKIGNDKIIVVEKLCLKLGENGWRKNLKPKTVRKYLLKC